MSDVFISYARPDRSRAQRLADAFERQEWSVFWDPKIPPGKMFDEVIEQELESARCIVVLWSKKSVSSRWVLDEASEGATRGILIPALIDEVKIPIGFRRIQTSRLVDWQGLPRDPEYNMLLQAVAGLLGRAVKAEPEEGSTSNTRAAEAATRRKRGKQESVVATKAKLRLKLVDVYGGPIDDRVDIHLKHTVTSKSIGFKGLDGSKRINIQELDGGRYEVEIHPTRYYPVTRSLIIDNDMLTDVQFVLPVNRNRVERVEFPTVDALPPDLRQVLDDSELKGFKGGHDLYQSLDDLRKANLLNLYAKMVATVFETGESVFSYVQGVILLRADRFFVRADRGLQLQTEKGVSYKLFHPVPGVLHRPPDGFSHAGSLKTLENYGNLQLTFFENQEAPAIVIDADIDDAQGIQHVFQVVRSESSFGQLHPFDIHQILVEYQKINPMYRLVV